MVTGVSTGVGWGIAGVLVQKGFHVFGTVRKEADAARLHWEFGSDFTPLVMDVADEAEMDRAAGQVRALPGNAKLNGLVNNAGFLSSVRCFICGWTR